MENIKLNNNNVNLQIDKILDFQDTYKICALEKGYVITRTIKNIFDKTLILYPFKAVLRGISFDGKTEEDYFYCNENARLFNTLTVPLDYNRLDDNSEENKRFALPVDRGLCDPGVVEGRICSSPYQPFPAILISNHKSKVGIVCGSLSQDVFYHSFEVGHNEDGGFLEIYSAFKDIAYREIKPQEELVDIFYIGETEEADDINKIFDNYTSVLRGYLQNNAGAKDTNRHSLIWDSWNDGIYRNVSEEMLVKEAKVVKKLFPNVEWFQLDDGYSSYCHENVDLDAHGLGVVYEGDDGVDKIKFPNGLKGYTDKIKEIGLKPAIWIGGFCPVKTKIYQENPEWFIDYTYRINWTQPLDVSQEQAREYMCFALDTFINKYGFEGVKHDFWSYAFEDRHDLLKNKDKSGYEHREWWHKEIRKRLPEYGYLETGCDVCMGNPFIGKYFNNYRFGDDIAAGSWGAISTTIFWGVTVLSTHMGDVFIPNSDSIGLLPGLNDQDFMLFVNFQIITRTLVEISGRFSQVVENNPRLKVIRRAVQYLNNGEDVYFAKYDYRKKGVNLPEIIYIDSAFDCKDDSYKTVAVFNCGTSKKTIDFSTADIGLNNGEHEVEFVWENKREHLSKFSIVLESHQSVLLKIKK
jgi:hypothetical protein